MPIPKVPAGTTRNSAHMFYHYYAVLFAFFNIFFAVHNLIQWTCTLQQEYWREVGWEADYHSTTGLCIHGGMETNFVCMYVCMYTLRVA